jgi:predicted NAD/FAD-binding protein
MSDFQIRHQISITYETYLSVMPRRKRANVQSNETLRKKAKLRKKKNDALLVDNTKESQM